MKNKVIIVAGPTASGKTSLGIEIAQRFGGEIISADSMQVYKGMSIATAAPTDEEKARAVHHLVEFMSAGDSFSVAQWQELAKDKINDIISRGKLPIVVGGTGLFIDSLVDNIKYEDIPVDEELRRSLTERDADELYDELTRVDCEAAKGIHKNNKKRVVRALELYYSGTSKTRQNELSKCEPSPYDFLYIVTEYANRQVLYDRINKRVDLMLENGLLDEAKKMLSESGGTSAQAIGHKELKKYLDGEATLEEAAEELKKETRRYAKRQITWFKRRNNAVRIDFSGDREKAQELVLKKCGEFLNG